MTAKSLTQKALAERSGVGQTTVSLYLNPQRRQPGKSGKVPSAKLSEVESLAGALDVEIWELLRDFTPEQRTAYKHIEAAFMGMNPEAAPKQPEKPQRKSA